MLYILYTRDGSLRRKTSLNVQSGESGVGCGGLVYGNSQGHGQTVVHFPSLCKAVYIGVKYLCECVCVLVGLCYV